MPSETDRRFDAVMAAITGPGGPIAVARDATGRADRAAGCRATLPGFFRCLLRAPWRGRGDRVRATSG